MDKFNETPMLGWQIEEAMDEQLHSMQRQIEEQAKLIAKQALLIKHYESQILMLKRRKS